MIKFTYQLSEENSDNFVYLEIKGHANYEHSGKDLVCAAVSAIVNGTVNFLQTNYASFFLITYQPAFVKISFLKKSSWLSLDNKELQACLKMFLYQLKNISLSYPRYLEIKKIP